LPDACLYGRVTPETLDEFVSRIEAGEADFSRLRGRSSYPPLVQAAEAALGRQGARLLHVEGTPDAGSVTFADERDRLTVSVRRAPAGMAVVKSCGDEVPDTVHPFVRD
ncbi:MAG TPA: hypothetical protein VIS76_15035, partial [Pseudomonadales bacterium]